MLLVHNHCKNLTLDPERGVAGRSDHVGVSEHVLVAAGRKLLRPVDDSWFEEATTTQLEEGHQVPHNAQTVERREERMFSLMEIKYGPHMSPVLLILS